MALRLPMYSDMITPRSRSTWACSMVEPSATSRSQPNARSSRSGVISERSRLKVVDEKVVWAFWSRPIETPMSANCFSTVPGGKWVEPLKDMCSRKWATPRSFGASSWLPAPTIRITVTLRVPARRMTP